MSGEQTELSQEALDEIIESGDPAAIDAAMAQLYSTTDEVSVAAEPAIVPPSDDVVVEKEVVAAPASEETPKGVATKDGNNVIPYSVLSTTREQLGTANTELLTTKEQVVELEKQLEEQSRLIALSKTQFETNKLKMPVLPEHEKVDPEFLKNAGDYGEVGEALRILTQKNEYLASQLQSQAEEKPAADSAAELTPAQQARQAFQGNAELQTIFNDASSKGAAIEIDKALQISHAHLSVAERFNLVVERFNETSQVNLEKQIPAQPNAPASMSDVGGAAPVVESSIVDQLVAATDTTQADALDGMSAEALNDLLNSMQ